MEWGILLRRHFFMIKVVDLEVRVNMPNNDSPTGWFPEKELIDKALWKLALVK